MSFLHVAALLVGLFVGLPFVAHLLQRKRTDVQVFPPAHLVPASPPLARRRRQVDDPLLYAVRTLSVLALALLGAVPFVRCSGLTLGRQAGASVALAIVLDDSLSMRARTGDGPSRWERARAAARDVLEGTRDGDAIAVVLAGAPARIALASTTDLRVARAVLDRLKPSDRATDLEGAIDLGRALVSGLPQTDKRVVLLSDLADGHPEGAELRLEGPVALWAPVSDLSGALDDCAVIRADRQHGRVHAQVACSKPSAAAGRSIGLRAGARVFAEAQVPAASEVTLDIPAAAEGASDLDVALDGSDAIAEDDRAPVMASSGKLVVGVLSDPMTGHLPTGGPPAVEQALAALELDAEVRPLALLPERVEDLAALGGLVLDDPGGFTPEVRHALGAWLERGGVALLSLGPHAGLLSLGSSFEPLVAGPVGWAASAPTGVDAKGASALGPASEGLVELHARGRATLDPASIAPPSRVVARWQDGAPWLVERPIGRGLALVLTLPTSPDVSDLALRPAFLSLLDRFVDAARARGGTHRTEVGQPWVFESVRSLSVLDPSGVPVSVAADDGRALVTPDLVGRYTLTVEGERLSRIAAPNPREVDLRPRAVSPSARASALGGMRAQIDISPYVAVALLALLLCELGLRWFLHRMGRQAPGEVARPAGT